MEVLEDHLKMWVGVLSETRGKIHPEIFDLFEGMDFIIHCGGIGSAEVINELSNLSPINGVLGPSDDPEIFSYLGPILVRELGGIDILVVNKVGAPAKPTEAVRDLIIHHEPKIVLFGQSGEPFNGKVDDRHWFSPGAANPKSAKSAASVGILEIEGASVRAEIVPLGRLSGRT